MGDVELNQGPGSGRIEVGNEVLKYLGASIQELPRGILPSNKQVLQLFYGHFGGTLVGFRGWDQEELHCLRITRGNMRNNRDNFSCEEPAGCVMRGAPCFFRKIKSEWSRAKFPTVVDKYLWEKLKKLKNKYSMECRKKNLNPNYLEELNETFNMAPNNYVQIVTEDENIEPADKAEKIRVLNDYIGENATRQEAVEPEGEATRRRREVAAAGAERMRLEQVRRAQQQQEREARETERLEREEREEEQGRQEGYCTLNNNSEGEAVDDDDGSEDDMAKLMEIEFRRARKKKEQEEGIEARIPVNILELTAGLAMLEGISERSHLFMVAAFYIHCGENLDNYFMNSLKHKFQVYL